MENSISKNALKEFAEILRSECIQAARDGFRDASMSGLCAEGAMEAAIGGIQSLDVDKLAANYLNKNG